VALIETVYAKDSFTTVHPDGGRPILVKKGQHWAAEDPIVKRHPEAFSADPRWGLEYTREPEGYADPPYEDRPVEQTTAAPGEKRNVRRADHG